MLQVSRGRHVTRLRIMEQKSGPFYVQNLAKSSWLTCKYMYIYYLDF